MNNNQTIQLSTERLKEILIDFRNNHFLFGVDEYVKSIVEKQSTVNNTTDALTENDFTNFLSSLDKTCFEHTLLGRWNEYKESKQKPLEYEIMSIYDNDEDIVYRSNFSVIDDFYKLVNHPYFKIRSIKRLADNQSFSIDEVTEQGKITGFKLFDGFVMCVEFEGGSRRTTLSELQKATPKPVLFTTTDNVPMYEGDVCWYVNQTLSVRKWVAEQTKYMHHDDIKYFSTQEAAQEYVIMNKPCLTINDLFSQYKEGTQMMSILKDDLIKLVQSKNKQR